jgi:hypothetical protein
MGKPDITQDRSFTWDQFQDQSAASALAAIHGHAEAFSNKCRGWYWTSIRRKRAISKYCRLMTFLLGGFGVVAPIIAALGSDSAQKFLWSQFAVVALAMAGLMQLADRIFGWSSGWLRYVSTVTAMENLARKFQLDWAAYFLNLGKAITTAEIRPLFDIAERFETQLADLQTRETDSWIVEFNTGLATLNEIVKTAREAADKSATEARAATEALDKAAAPGAIELTVTTTEQPQPAIAVTLDGDSPESCNGMSWGKLKVLPGQHRVRIQALRNNQLASELVRIVEVPANGTARLTVAM